MKIAEAGPVR